MSNANMCWVTKNKQRAKQHAFVLKHKKDKTYLGFFGTISLALIYLI